jgi:SAM-dependent methyltransferase
MDRPRHRIEFPPPEAESPDQDEAFFHLWENGERTRIRFHDYHEIYSRPGLYEQLFYDRLKCQSPSKVAAVLQEAVLKSGEAPSELRVLDLGAGNGMAGEALTATGAARLVGVDIIDEARQATLRDRVGIYDHYYVCDFCALDDELREELQGWRFNCFVSVAALGFGDIPPRAIGEALQLVQPGGWIAFNIKDSFLDATDDSGFSTLMRQLIFSQYLDLYHLDRYRHRLSIDGSPLNYFAIVGRKASAEFPAEVQEMLGMES